MKESISRRDFITTSVLIGAGIFAATKVSAFEKKQKYKMGLQLYTIRDAMERDLSGTLKKVKAFGYQDLETYGFDPGVIGYYGRKAKDFKNMLDDLGLITTSGHYDLFRFFNTPEADLIDYVDRCIEGATQLGHKYITWPWLNEEDRTLDKFRILASKLNLIGERITKAGLGFAYHNHDFEFIDHNGENGYNILMKETDSRYVKFQIDLYWAMHSSKLSPAELFRKQPGRFVMWHIKDMHKLTRDYTELGNGSIDYTAILPDANLSGLQYYYIEQGGNFRINSMESIKESAKYFQWNLAKYL